VRSRHGTQAGRFNSDYARAGRASHLIVDALRKVRHRGDGPALSDLALALRGKTATDLPTTRKAARALFGRLATATLRDPDVVVFTPARWSYADHTTPIYTYRLRLPRVRRWISHHFADPAAG
jgi:hypothetical protein